MIQPKIIILIHKVREREKQKLIWLDEVKIYGNKPMKLLNIIKKNRPINIIKLEKENFSKILNSFNR